MSAEKPFSAASERNQAPILNVLREHFADCHRVLEIGSGTGQHAVHFARGLPHLVWQPSDRAMNLDGIRAWRDEAALPNLDAPFEFDVTGSWPSMRFDAVFTANTLHIMAWEEVRHFFGRLPALLEDEATLVVYGPFNYEGRYASDSNAAFDQWLETQGAHMAIRDFESVNALARDAGLSLHADVTMPANNRCLVWRRGRA